MLVYNVITSICLALMVLGLVSVVINLIRKNRTERIIYLRSFKRGKSAIVYLFAMPLYWIATVFDGDSVFNAFFVAVRRMGELVMLRYDINSVKALAEANPLFNFTMYFCFIVVTLNTVLFAVSLASQMAWSYARQQQFKHARKQKLVLFGNNQQNHLIYKSDTGRVKLVVDKIDNEQTLGLYLKDIAYQSVTMTDAFVKALVTNCLKGKQQMIAIVNTGEEEKNIALCRTFIKHTLALDEQDREQCFLLLKIFVFGDPKYERIYGEVVADSFGCITYVNKYQKIAVDCINKYPFTQFMDERHVNYQTSLVKPNVDINAFFIGFGKTNQQIFLTSVANNQFVTQTPDGIGVKKVQYHVFDKNHAENNKNLNHNYNRYKNECANVDPNDYLPLPDYPADEHFYHLDINDMAFYNAIKQVVQQNANSVNFVYIAFGEDLENVDMAQKLLAKCHEWNVDNVTFFVKIHDDHQGQGLLDAPNCYQIGSDKEVVYDIESILGDDVFTMAQMRNAVYDLEYQLTCDPTMQLTEQAVLQIKSQAYKNWYFKKSQMERDSSLYCCLSLRSKLHLMGLDYCKPSVNDKAPLNAQEYLDIYAVGDMPNLDYYNLTVDGKPIVRYSAKFANSRRRSLAIHEHLRWNAFMISNGIIPATKKQILEEKSLDGKFTNGRNYSVRRHGNITTFDGLLEYRKLIAQRDRQDGDDVDTLEELKDVIKYDYQLLDDAHWLLTKAGFKIVKR